ncbi:hypothetical protein L6164_023241 [Bauhinia variegata]|uniref:Uncharacterized protein n=1 Tax=Bauhinia variegata TaxID=167791 RepID=A0ACB9MHM5_BAUVA|nr:hypothetical protein L6164_023241 [Bauhinia variegata]
MPWQQHGGVSRGEIVLVRVSFPYKWWPALVLCSDDLGVLVSFFDHENLSPRYFIESEVISFENNVRLLLGDHKNVDNTETFYGLLDSALKLLSRRVISSLKCPCQMPRRDESDGGNNGGGDFNGYNSFQPFGLLNFVRKVAVLPWVYAPDIVDAIRAVAQVQAFRGYCSVKQKMMYKESRMRGKNMMLHPCSSLDENMHSIIQESGALQPKQRKAEYLKEISFHLPSLGLDPFYLLGTCTQFIRQSHLFKHILDQDYFFPGNSKIQLNGYANRREGNSEELFLSLPNVESAIYLTRKRRRLEQPAPYDYSFKLRRIVSCSSTSDAYLSPQSKEDISDVLNLSSALVSCLANSNGNHLEFFEESLSKSPVKLTIQDLGSNRGLSETYIGGNSRMNLVDNESSCVSLLKDASYCVGFPETDIVQGTKRDTDITRDTELTCIKMLEPGESIKRGNQSCIFFCETKMNRTDGVGNEDTKRSHSLTLHQPFACESLFDSVLGTRSNDCEVGAGAATTKGSLGSCSNDDQIRSQIITNGDTTTKLKGSVQKVSSWSGSMENKGLCPSSTSHSTFTCKAGQQSKPHAPFASGTSLHMKFPKNFNLPSKEELMKKFSIFGTIDSLNTRVFDHTGSAQVAFFQEVDAVAAFSYAKMKKVSFGQANVRFRLRPFKDERSELPPLASVSSSESKPEAEGLRLKSCLKNPTSSKKENWKKHRRVSFTMET